MKTKKFVMLIIFLLLITVQLLFVFQTQAYTDERVDVHLFFSWMEEDGSWHEWVRVSDENESILYNDLTLKIGQPVKCKIIITPFDTCIISFWLKEPGVTKCYDILEGMSHNEYETFYIFKPGTETEYLEKHPETVVSYPNETLQYTWVLQTNKNGTGWNGVPLNCFWDVGSLYTYDEYDVNEEISFTYAKILNEQWAGPSYLSGGDDDDDGNTNTNENNNKSTPGFEALFIVFALCVVLFIYRKR